MRCITLAAALLAAASPASFADDSDEVKRLKARIELLEAKLEAATLRADSLQKENDQFKAGKGKRPATPTKAGRGRALADILVEDFTVRGDFRFVEGKNATGDWTLTIKERKGKKFTGAYTAKGSRPPGPPLEVDVFGEVVGDRVTFTVVNSAKVRATVSGVLRNELLELECHGLGGKAKMAAKVAR